MFTKKTFRTIAVSALTLGAAFGLTACGTNTVDLGNGWSISDELPEGWTMEKSRSYGDDVVYALAPGTSLEEAKGIFEDTKYTQGKGMIVFTSSSCEGTADPDALSKEKTNGWAVSKISVNDYGSALSATRFTEETMGSNCSFLLAQAMDSTPKSTTAAILQDIVLGKSAEVHIPG